MESRGAHARFVRERRVPAGIAGRLVALGHLDVVRARAAAGDAGCAEVLAAHDPDHAALPRFTDAGWWPVLRERARALHARGRTDDGLALLTPWAADHRVVREVAVLLAAQGRRDEVVAVLLPRHGEPGLAAALVELAGADGAGVLRPFAATNCRAAVAVAADLERRGGVDEAMAVLRPHLPVVLEHAADLLHRHGRTGDLRAWIGAGLDRGGRLAARLADLLEADGDVAGAAEVLTQVERARLYGRHQRGTEAVAILTGLIGLIGADGDPECALRALGEVDATAALAVAEERCDDVDLFLVLVDLLVARGRAGDAVAALRARPDLAEPHLTGRLAEILAGQGRDDEAVAALTGLTGPSSLATATLLAELLLRHGRVRDALAALDRYHETRGAPGIMTAAR